MSQSHMYLPRGKQPTMCYIQGPSQQKNKTHIISSYFSIRPLKIAGWFFFHKCTELVPKFLKVAHLELSHKKFEKRQKI